VKAVAVVEFDIADAAPDDALAWAVHQTLRDDMLQMPTGVKVRRLHLGVLGVADRVLEIFHDECP